MSNPDPHRRLGLTSVLLKDKPLLLFKDTRRVTHIIKSSKNIVGDRGKQIYVKGNISIVKIALFG
jgi:hypothetical protein